MEDYIAFLRQTSGMFFARGQLSEKESLRFSKWSLFWEKGRERFVNFHSLCTRCRLINL